MRFSVKAVAVAFLLSVALLQPNAHASSFSSVVVFGDSLSDNGNRFAAVGYPPAPYYQGRFSNGPVAVEQLAVLLNAPLFDFAYGGATAGVGNTADGGTQAQLGAYSLPGMLTQAAAVLGTMPAPGKADANALYVVWGGANDFDSSGSPDVAAADILQIVSLLQADGAQHILVPGLPNLALTPEYYSDALAAAYTTQFNSKLRAGLRGGATFFDTAGLLDAIVANPASFNLTNVTQPCILAPTTCSQSLFYDKLHPTTTADAILAQQFAAAATPEPASLLLLVTGLSGMLAMGRKRLQAR